MRQICEETPGLLMANMLEGGGDTPILSHAELADMGFNLAAYPLTLLSAVMQQMVETLAAMKADTVQTSGLMSFEEVRERVGFNAYYAASEGYNA